LTQSQSRRLTSGGTAEADRPRHFGCGFAALRLGVSAVNVQPTFTKPQRYAEEIRTQQNYAGSGEIQEEGVDVDGHNRFQRLRASRKFKGIGGTKHE